MTAAFATFAFLATLWAIAVVGGMVLERSGGKILAALQGRSMQPALRSAMLRSRHAPRAQVALRATPRQRAAA